MYVVYVYFVWTVEWCDGAMCVCSNARECGRNTVFADAKIASAHSVLLPLNQSKITLCDRVYVCILKCVILRFVVLLCFRGCNTLCADANLASAHSVLHPLK